MTRTVIVRPAQAHHSCVSNAARLARSQSAMATNVPSASVQRRSVRTGGAGLPASTAASAASCGSVTP
jgi:hypothetical protein